MESINLYGFTSSTRANLDAFAYDILDDPRIASTILSNPTFRSPRSTLPT
jgi:hypothetical protein